MNVVTETHFVAGNKEVNTGNCSTFGPDWETSTREEARRIAEGLGGVVVEVGRGPTRLRLDIQVSGTVVARVTAR